MGRIDEEPVEIQRRGLLGLISSPSVTKLLMMLVKKHSDPKRQVRSEFAERELESEKSVSSFGQNLRKLSYLSHSRATS